MVDGDKAVCKNASNHTRLLKQALVLYDIILKSQHQIHLGQRMIDLTNPPVSKRQKTHSTIIEKKSQERTYAELAAVDRLSFFSIAKSQVIRRPMSKDVFNCHVSKDTIRSKVFTYYDEAEAE